MENKAQTSFISYVFYSIVSTIIFLLIYSYFFAPEMISNVYDITRDKIDGIGETISDNFEKSSSDSNSVTGNAVNEQKSECLEQINRKIEIAKGKSAVRLTTNIREYKTFDSTQDALDYLESWEYLVPEGEYSYKLANSFRFPIFYNVNYSNSPPIDIIDYEYIEIILIRADWYIEGNKYGELIPAICVNKQLEQFNKGLFF